MARTYSRHKEYKEGTFSSGGDICNPWSIKGKASLSHARGFILEALWHNWTKATIASCKEKRESRWGSEWFSSGWVLRFDIFAGGDPNEISLIHQVSYAEVFNSVWMVVDAVNNTSGLNIKFPSDYDVQEKMAAQCEKKSEIGL